MNSWRTIWSTQARQPNGVVTEAIAFLRREEMRSLTRVLITVKARVHEPRKIASTCIHQSANRPICQYASATIIYRFAYVSRDSISSLLIASPLQVSTWARVTPIGRRIDHTCVPSLSDVFICRYSETSISHESIRRDVISQHAIKNVRSR